MAKDFYEVLGVEPHSDVVVIKRRYRQMVRQYHPDIATNREAAHEMMLAINEAWTVLSDPAERARYDRSRAPRPPRADAPQRSSTRTRTESRPGAPAGHGQRPAGARGSTTRTRLLTVVFEAAELYFFQGRAAEAIEMCGRVMKADPQNAEAPALLGDIYAEQGKNSDAISMYELAARNQPHNQLYQQKLTALRGVAPPSREARDASAGPRVVRPAAGNGPGGAGPSAAAERAGFSARRTGFGRNLGGVPAPQAGDSAYASAFTSSGAGVRDSTVDLKSRKKMAAAAKSARRAAPAGSGSSAWNETVAHAERVTLSRGGQEKTRTVVGVALIVAAAAIEACSTWMFPAPAVWGPAGANPDVMALAATGVAGCLLGAALPLLAIVQRCGQVQRGQPAWMGIPLLVALLAAGAALYPAALALFLVVAVVRRHWNASLFTVLLTGGLWSAVLAVSKPGDFSLLSNVLLHWTGWVILPSVVLGWALGSTASKQ